MILKWRTCTQRGLSVTGERFTTPCLISTPGFPGVLHRDTVFQPSICKSCQPSPHHIRRRAWQPLWTGAPTHCHSFGQSTGVSQTCHSSTDPDLEIHIPVFWTAPVGHLQAPKLSSSSATDLPAGQHAVFTATQFPSQILENYSRLPPPPHIVLHLLSSYLLIFPHSPSSVILPSLTPIQGWRPVPSATAPGSQPVFPWLRLPISSSSP